jgi:hypothetical protein
MRVGGGSTKVQVVRDGADLVDLKVGRSQDCWVLSQ